MDLDELTTLQLQAEARDRGLSDHGARDELLERLRADDDAEQQDEHAEHDNDDAEKQNGDGQQQDEHAEQHDNDAEKQDDGDMDGDAESGDDDNGQQDDRTSDKRESDDGPDASGDGGRDGRAEADEAADELVPAVTAGGRWLRAVTGGRIETVSRIERLERGLAVVYEVVELPRIPPAEDQLGSYEVVMDRDGAVVACERRRRYVRAERGT